MITPEQVINELEGMNYWIDTKDGHIEYGFIGSKKPARAGELLKEISNRKDEFIEYLESIAPKVDKSDPRPELDEYFQELLNGAYERDIFLWGYLMELREEGVKLIVKGGKFHLSPSPETNKEEFIDGIKRVKRYDEIVKNILSNITQ